MGPTSKGSGRAGRGEGGKGKVWEKGEAPAKLFCLSVTLMTAT